MFSFSFSGIASVLYKYSNFCTYVIQWLLLSRNLVVIIKWVSRINALRLFLCLPVLCTSGLN